MPALRLFHPTFIAPPGFSPPTSQLAYFVPLEIDPKSARALMTVIGFPADAKIVEGADRWTAIEGNRAFAMQRRFGGDWSLHLVEPLCFSADVCAAGAKAPVNPAPSDKNLATATLNRLAAASGVTLATDSVVVSDGGQGLATARAGMLIGAQQVEGVEFTVTVDREGNALFASGELGPFDAVEERVPLIPLEAALAALTSTGLVGDATAALGSEVTLSSGSVVLSREPGRAWRAGKGRALDIVPRYIFKAADGRTFSVLAIDASPVATGGPAATPT